LGGEGKSFRTGAGEEDHAGTKRRTEDKKGPGGKKEPASAPWRRKRKKTKDYSDLQETLYLSPWAWKGINEGGETVLSYGSPGLFEKKKNKESHLWYPGENCRPALEG